MNLEARTTRKIFSVVAIATLILASCSRKAESTLPEASLTPQGTPTAGMTTPTPMPTSAQRCVEIAYPQPKNAFRAWIALGEPDQLEFDNIAGPDGDGSRTTVTRPTLPRLVHVGDRFCTKH